MYANLKTIALSLIILTLVGSISVFAAESGYSSDSVGRSYDSSEVSAQTEAQQNISEIFNNLETVGSNYNGGGSSAAGLALVDSACRAAIERSMQARLFLEMKDSLTPSVVLPSAVDAYISQKVRNFGQGAMSQLCAALKGEAIQSPEFSQDMKDSLRNEFIPQILSFGQDMAHSSGIPFLSRLEIEMGTSQKSLIGSITSVQPLWQDENDLHHVFAQLSWYKAPDTVSDNGETTQYDTYNAGMAYRYLTTDKNHLYGANMFFDYAPHNDHTRMSIGVDARTSQLAISANRYIPLSTWRSVDSYNEERASAGWDTEVRGQVPQLPSWTGIIKGYQWDGFKEGDKVYGAQTAVEYSPVPALALRVGVRDESDSSASLEAALRFNWRFDQPQDLQLKPRTELASVADYVYEKVQRDNIIRVKQRRKASSKLTVIETAGVNSAVEASGSSSLRVGQSLLMPVTVTTANSVGAISRLRFSDGSVLTSGQNTQVRVEPNLITLITGSIQYVNNGIVQNIVVPGGTIALHGTDLDVISNGVDSTVRLRDGSITFTGNVSGSATLAPEQMAQSITGIVGTVATGSATYITHTDTVSTAIDRVADPQNGPKVSPYPYEAPRIIGNNMVVGGQIVFGLRFNDAVTVSGGTPQLAFTINGFSRLANYVSGSGTNDLRFTYTVVALDVSATTLTVNSLNKNGSSIMGNGKDAVTTIADVSLPIVGGGGDVIPPSGYGVAFTTSPINDANRTAVAFDITSAEVGTTYAYTITSSGGGTPVTGSGTVTSATQSRTGVNVSSLSDGTLTLSVILTDAAANSGTAATDTVTKDATVPSGYAAAFTTSPINNANQTAVAFDITSAEVGTTYSYTINSSGGGTAVTGSGTVSAATQSITAVDVSGLTDGTLTLSVILTDGASNAGAAVSSTAVKDSGVPTGYTASFTTSPVNNANKTAASFNIASAEVGTTYSYTINSSGGGTAVTGSGTVSSVTQSITGIDVSALADGTLTVSTNLTDASGNAGSAVTATVTKDIVAPTGYAATFTTSPVNNGNKTAAAFDMTSATVGSTYNYSISSSGGGTAVTGSGTVSTATQSVSGIDVSALGDGTLTLSLTLTSTTGNTGAAVTATVTKDVAIPSGYAAAFTTSPVNNANKSAAAFNITSAIVGSTYNYSISSSGGGTAVTGSGTVSSATQAVTGLDLSALGDGTLTVSVTLTSGSGNTGSAVTATATKDVVAPTGYTAAFTTSPINDANLTAAAFTISSAEVGATYNYVISSSGGGTNVTGSGTVATATQAVTGINLTGLSDGTLTVSVTLTDTNSNAGTAATNTVLKNTAAPTGYSVAFTTDPINNSNKTAVVVTASAAEVGSTYSYTVTDGVTTIGPFTGTITTATQAFAAIDVSSLVDGTLTVSMTLTDTGNNAGAAVTDTVVKDIVAPTIVSVTVTDGTYEP